MGWWCWFGCCNYPKNDFIETEDDCINKINIVMDLISWSVVYRAVRILLGVTLPLEQNLILSMKILYVQKSEEFPLRKILN